MLTMISGHHVHLDPDLTADYSFHMKTHYHNCSVRKHCHLVCTQISLTHWLMTIMTILLKFNSIIFTNLVVIIILKVICYLNWRSYIFKLNYNTSIQFKLNYSVYTSEWWDHCDSNLFKKPNLINLTRNYSLMIKFW